VPTVAQFEEKSQEELCSNKLLPTKRGIDPDHKGLDLTNVSQEATVADFNGQKKYEQKGEC